MTVAKKETTTQATKTKKTTEKSARKAAPRRKKVTIAATEVREGDRTERGDVQSVTFYGEHHVILGYEEGVDPQDLAPSDMIEVSRLPE